MIYAFWSNQGRTGKTSLIFQAICRYAELHPGQRILAIDLCPQANLSELLLGGLEGNGSAQLQTLYDRNGRVSIGGYFQSRLPSPYSAPKIETAHYICHPHQMNPHIPENIDLVAGDRLVELQSSIMLSLANLAVPGSNAWIQVMDWLKDFVDAADGKYQAFFIDTNPSFSIYTQIALSVANRLVLPVMADDSSRRAIKNAFSLIYGSHLPSAMYDEYSFHRKLNTARRPLPQVHLVVKNRLTQYMGPASAYQSVLTSVESDIAEMMQAKPNIFTFTNLSQGIAEVRDFQTTGVVAHAFGMPFSKLKSGKLILQGEETQIRAEYLENCRQAVDSMAERL